VHAPLTEDAKMLVPSRWQKSGWHYVNVDPREAKFFTNPNRANLYGSPFKQPKEEHEFGTTTYTHFY
jgi:hypothetical protein